MDIQLLQPDAKQLLEIRNGARCYLGFTFAQGALPPRPLLDQSRYLLSPTPLSYRWTAPFLILDKSTNIVVGSIGGKGLLDGEDEVELGYNVAPQYRNQGVAKQAIKLITDMAIATDLTPVAHVEPQNTYSSRALLANGYVSDGLIVLSTECTLERYRYRSAN